MVRRGTRGMDKTLTFGTIVLPPNGLFDRVEPARLCNVECRIALHEVVPAQIHGAIVVTKRDASSAPQEEDRDEEEKEEEEEGG